MEVSASSESTGNELEQEEGSEGGERAAAAGGLEEKERETKVKDIWEHPTGRMLTMAGLFDIWNSESAVSAFAVHTSE